METEAEYKVSPKPIHIDEVLEKINEIAKESDTGDYIYRGESKCHKKVSSSLYRQYLDIEVESFDVAVVQADILRAAHEYTPHKMEDFELLATLQRYGDQTNLIDFTTNYLVALFFACDGKPEEPGRVILLQRQPEVGDKAYTVEKPPGTTRRAEAQKSIFVQAEKGFVEPDKVVCIPADLKLALLDYLDKHHDISTKTIYNDLHGFIDKRRVHKRAYAAFHKGLTSQGRADSAETEAERQKGYNDAITHYTKAIDLKPDLVEAYNNRGVAYRHTGDFSAALSDFNKAIELSPEDAGVYIDRGLAYDRQGDFSAALDDYSKAIGLSPENAWFYGIRGFAYDGQGDFSAAISDFNKAIELSPEDAWFYSNRGVVYAGQGDFAAAISDYSKAIELSPEDAQFYSNRGLAYAGQGDFAAALADYSKAIDLDPENAWFYSNRGLAYAGQGDFAAALADYNKAIDLSPENAWFYGDRGVAYAGQSDFDAALSDFNKAIELSPEDADFYIDRGFVYRHTGDFGAAIADYSRAIDLNAENARTYNNRGEAWLHLKEWQEAKADLTTAKDMGYDIIASFQNDYESVEDFEAQHDAQVPADVAVLLQRK